VKYDGLLQKNFVNIINDSKVPGSEILKYVRSHMQVQKVHPYVNKRAVIDGPKNMCRFRWSSCLSFSSKPK